MALVQYLDFSGAGLVFVPPSSPEYAAMVADVGKLGRIRPEQRERSVVFVNRGNRNVVMAQVIWRFVQPDGERFLSSVCWLGKPLLLLPFGLTSRAKKVLMYRAGVLPGSKRYLAEGGIVVGDNTDVRSPAADEIWNGGAEENDGDAIVMPPDESRLEICLGGAFFENGEFFGTNDTRLFERQVAELEASNAILAMVEERSGKTAKVILDDICEASAAMGEVEKVWVTPNEKVTQEMRYKLAFRELTGVIVEQRRFNGDQFMVATIRRWSGTKLPTLRRGRAQAV